MAIYTGCVASIYRTCRIYISGMQYLYIQYHRYIAARRGKMKEKCSAFLMQMIEHIDHSYYQLRCVRKPKKSYFSFYKKLGVWRQEVNFLPTNSQLLVDKKLEVCNILIIRDDFFLYKKDIRTYILLVFSCLDHYLKLHCLLWIRTSNVIILNITCSGSHHYLFSD